VTGGAARAAHAQPGAARRSRPTSWCERARAPAHGAEGWGRESMQCRRAVRAVRADDDL